MDPQEYPTLIVLDVNMPGMNGEEALLRLKRNPQYRHIPVVMLTTGSRLPSQYTDMGAEAFIKKPFYITDWQRSVTSLFERLSL